MVTKKLKYFEYGCHSEKGNIKSVNYDGYKSFDSPNGFVFVICDGRDELGEKAKYIALERIQYFMENEFVENPFEAVESALIYAGGYIYEHLRKNDEWHESMAVSCLCVLVRDNKIYYSSLGNCHMYLFNGKRLYQLTQDISPGAFDSPGHDKERSSHWLGSGKVPAPFVCEQPLVPLNEDMLIICTDGLYEFVSERSIKKILSDPMPVYTKACRLADIASETGGSDNVTVQIVSFYNLPHDQREFIAAEPSKKEELPKTAKVNITGNRVWNSVIIGVILLIVAYMFYDLFLFDPTPPIEIEDIEGEHVELVDSVGEPGTKHEKEVDKPVDFESALRHFAPADTVYRIRSGDSWSSIYRRFEVCSWFIRDHEDNEGKFDRHGNPVAGRVITIPLVYSANSQYNPRFYKDFTTDKVGGACQYANEKLIEDFHESLIDRYLN